jgi:hypothetical protein
VPFESEAKMTTLRMNDLPFRSIPSLPLFYGSA